ncbi:MAG: FkbM family methyltransferase [Pseudomonadota bacterium]
MRAVNQEWTCPEMYHRFTWTRVSHRRNWISREYEPLQPYYLLQLSILAKARTFVDVGANVGLYSVIMSQAVDRVHAYEANGALVREAEFNFRSNNVVGTVQQVAVSRKAGTVVFGIVSRYAGDSAVIDGEGLQKDISEKKSVRSVCLDDELQAVHGPVVLKIDVEGHEMAVLQGAKNMLKEKSCILQIEDFNESADRYLGDLGYRRITKIGPDAYFTNDSSLQAVEAYEGAVARLIEANHETKSMSFGRGPVSIVISGRVYDNVRGLARRFLRGRL